MGLPLTRERTYTPSSPVRSADLNKIQDQIIGGKFGPRTFFVDAMSFVPISGAAAYDASKIPVNGGVYHAPILGLPSDGMTITEVTFHVKRASGTLTGKLRTRVAGTPYDVDLASLALSSGTSNATIVLNAAATLDSGSMPRTIDRCYLYFSGGVGELHYAEVIASYDP